MNEMERWELIFQAVEVLKICGVDAIWHRYDDGGNATLHIFRNDEGPGSAARVGEAFTKAYAEVRQKHFPKGEDLHATRK